MKGPLCLPPPSRGPSPSVRIGNWLGTLPASTDSRECAVKRCYGSSADVDMARY